MLLNSTQVWKQRFWMMHYGAECPKPSIVWCNDYCFAAGLVTNLHQGRLLLVWIDVYILY